MLRELELRFHVNSFSARAAKFLRVGKSRTEEQSLALTVAQI